MRVLHVYSGNLFGGIETILVALARVRQAPAEASHEFALCFGGRLADELRALNAPVHQLSPVRISRPHSARAARQALKRTLEANAFDRVVCHAPWTQGIFGGIVRSAGVPLVFWAHDVMTGRHWTERLARRTPPDLVVCNSRFTAGTLSRLYPDVPSTVIYAPVDPPMGAIDRADRERLRASLATAGDAVVIIQASRSEAWKGHAALLEALSTLGDIPDWVWWQVGGAQRAAEAAYLASLRDMAARAGIGARVRWVGERTDVPQLLAAADIHCQANVKPEPFGLAFVEALAAGLPVVTTDLGGAREIVDESCGVLVEPADPVALAGALRRLVEDGACRARLASGAPARARRLCNPAAQLHQLAVALRDMGRVSVGA